MRRIILTVIAVLALAFCLGFSGGDVTIGTVKQLVSESNVPTGGTTGQYLKKASGTDYDFSWETPGGSGDLVSTNNLSDVATAATAATNLGLGTGSDVTFNTVTAAAGFTTPQGASGQVVKIYEASGNGTNYFGLSVSDSMATDILVNAEDLAAEVITFNIDGGGSEITTGVKGFVEIPYDGLIKRVTVLADQSGSIVVDIWNDAYANYPPTNTDTITASTPPTITTATKAQDSTLTSWSKSVSAGDILGFNVDSCTTITRATISIYVEK